MHIELKPHRFLLEGKLSVTESNQERTWRIPWRAESDVFSTSSTGHHLPCRYSPTAGTTTGKETRWSDQEKHWKHLHPPHVNIWCRQDCHGSSSERLDYQTCHNNEKKMFSLYFLPINGSSSVNRARILCLTSCPWRGTKLTLQRPISIYASKKWKTGLNDLWCLDLNYVQKMESLKCLCTFTFTHLADVFTQSNFKEQQSSFHQL